MKLDWVVNDECYGTTAYAIPNGSIIGIPLTFSRHVMTEDTFAAGTVPGTSFPQGKRQFVKAVKGVMNFFVSQWAVGSTVDVMYRIAKKPQDLVSTGAITDPAYNLFLARFANERFAWQHSHYDTFTAGTLYKTQINVHAAVNQWLEPDEALFMFIHNVSGAAQTLRLASYLRTLMKADD